MQPATNDCFNYENSLFSSSLSEAFGKKLGLVTNDAYFGKASGATSLEFVEEDPFESSKEIEAQTIGDLLPKDDDLLSSLIDDLECVSHTNCGDEDLFCSGGGLEQEPHEDLKSRISGFTSGESSGSNIGCLNSGLAGEHFCKNSPSRTLIMRNVDSNVEDTELEILFQQFGDIRALHTASKLHGFIIISYYDIRAASNALEAIQERMLREYKFDIHSYIPKQDDASNEVIDHGTIIVSNLDSTVSDDDIHRIFGSCGEIKEIFHDPSDHSQRAIEFYDVRAAEGALCALNMGEIYGKRIMIEPGCPGAGRLCLGKHSSLELVKESSTIEKIGCFPNKSSLDTCVSTGSSAHGLNASEGLENEFIHCSTSLMSPFMENKFPVRVPMEVKHASQSSLDDLRHSLGQMTYGFRSMPTFHPHSFPEFHNGLIGGIPFNNWSIFPRNVADEIDNQCINRGGPVHISSHLLERKEENGSCPIYRYDYLSNNSSTNFHHPPGSMMWQNSSSFIKSIPVPPPPQSHDLPRGPSNLMDTFITPHHHHVGSAPAMNPMLWERCNSYSGVDSNNIYPHACRNSTDTSFSPILIGSPSLQQRLHMLYGRNCITSMPASYDVPSERIRSRRSDVSSNQADNKQQFELDIDRITRGDDPRTTLMIKNIPNKYTSKMLLAKIDEHHKGTYDFIYLPIDFKNKCNVGYAFINLTDPKHIIPFYQIFDGKKWEKFNSEKVASLAYARIQGKSALVAHFQNSSLMNEDKRCRPILFHSDGPNAGDQEPFPMGNQCKIKAMQVQAQQ